MFTAWFIAKVFLCLALFWNFYEIKKLEAIMGESRAKRFLNKVGKGLLVFMVARVTTVIIDYEMGIGLSIATPILVHGFFFFIAVLMHQRRKNIEKANKIIGDCPHEDELGVVLNTLRLEKDTLMRKTRNGH